MSIGLYGLLTAAGTASPTDNFIDGPGEALVGYGEFFSRVGRLAAVIADRIEPGDRVVVQVDKSVDALAVYLATIAAGGVYLPLNLAYPAGEVSTLVADAEPALRIAAPHAALAGVDCHAPVSTLRPDGSGSLADDAAAADPLPPVDRPLDAPAVMLYTSGTTGVPKGVVLTGANLAANARMLHDAWRFGPDDRLLHMLPLFHVHGLFVAMHPVLLAGASVSLHERFDVSAVLADLHRCTVVMGVPTMYSRLLADRRLDETACRHIRLFTSGSAPLPAREHEAFARRTGHAIVERYGMTEAGIITSNPYDGDRVPGTVGYALPGVELRVVDDNGASLPPGQAGAVETRGPNVFPHYWRRPEATASAFTDDGWLRTGDIGWLSDDGRLTLEGRASDLIISGGFNISPRQVEEALESASSVTRAAVVGIPHPDLGEAVVAFVIAGRFDESEVASALSDIARFKHPKRYVVVPELPLNAMGKIQKNRLRLEYADLFGHSQ